MGNEKQWSAVISKNYVGVRAVRQRDEDCTWKAKDEGKNIYLSVFPEFLELEGFCLSKFTKTIDLQLMRVTIMLRITSESLSRGWYHFKYSR